MSDGTQDTHAQSAAQVEVCNSRRKAGFVLACLCVLGLAATLGSGAPVALAAAPTVTIENASEVSFASAKVSGEVDPADHQVGYHFDYVTQAQFEASEWAEATQVGVGTLPEGAGPTPVSEVLTGLTPATVYHLRIRAVNGEDEVAEAIASTFETEAVSPPSASGLVLSAVTTDSAHFEGTVNSGGTGPGEKAGVYRFICSPECPGIEDPHEFEAEGFADGSGHTVEAEATGLQPNAEYTVTLRAQNAGAESDASESFTTDPIPPEAETLGLHGPIAATTARLLGTVNAHNSPTAYHFEYGTTAAYGSSTTDAGPASGNSAEAVGQNLTGLAPSTTYHYRIVADNGTGGPVFGADRTLTTAAAPAPQGECANEAIRQRQGAHYLPDCRGYELVSNLTWNGALSNGARLARGVDDRAAMGFIGAAAGSPSGATSSVLAQRTADGWKTRSLLNPPPQLVGHYGLLMTATPDLSGTVALYQSTFTGSKPTDFEFVRQLSGEQQSKSLQFFGYGIEGFNGVIASDDLTHVFDDTNAITFGFGETPESAYIYDYGSGAPVLVSRLPDNSLPTCGVEFNNSLKAFPNVQVTRTWTRLVSADGRRVFFHSAGNNCGAPAELYMRDTDAEETTLISGPPLAGPAEGATFIQATADGSKAFFFTATRLAPADTDNTVDVYRYTVGGGNECLTCGPVAANLPGVSSVGLGMPVVSEDGSHVYFQSAAPVAPGGTGDENDIYAWHDGHIYFVAPSSGMRPTHTEVTPDGNVLVFRSNNPLLDALSGSSNGARQQFYRYDDTDRTLTCISCPQDGSPAMAAAATTLIERGRRFTQVEGRRGMSADGSLVAFVTNSSLVPRDVNGGPDIYEWHDGQLGLISDGTSEYGIFGSERLGLLDVAPDGKNILFANAAKLTEDGIPGQPQVQVYTARVDGGFTKAQLASCEADACRAQPAAPSPAAAAATSSFAGPGNAKSRRHRAKHRRAKHHRKAHGQANDNRRTSR